MSVVVLDAAAVVDVLIGRDDGHRLRARIRADADLHTVAHLDAEVLSALGRLHRAGDLSVTDVDARLRTLASLPLRRVPITGGLLERAWSLRERVALRDALYVAAAMGLDGKVLTTDARLRRAVPDHTIRLP